MAPSYAHGAGAAPLLGETIGENLDRTIARFGDREALVSVHQDVRLTYDEFGQAVDRLARALVASGIGPAIVSASGARTARSGCSSSTRPPRRASCSSTSTPPTARRSSPSCWRSRGAGRSSPHGRSRARTTPRWSTRCGPTLPALERVVYLESEQWRELLDGADAELPDRQFDEPINIQYTSGTTGFPKGAALSHHNILNNGYFIGEGCRYTERDRVCIPVPFYHCFGMVLGNLACTTHGACMVIPAPAFDPVATLAAVESERCTSLYGVPTMFIAELEHERFGEFDLTSLRTGIMAGSPCPIETMRRVVSEMHMDEVTICYGMTETSPVSTQTAAGDPLEKRVSTVGRVHPHVEIKIVDPETGAIVPAARPASCARAATA